MAEVITFTGYTPPARYDALPWTDVEIEEAATEDGTYTLLETIALSPVDADPEDPAARSFTTELGTAADQWYRIRFVDGSGDHSQYTTPIQNTASTAEEIEDPYATVSQLAAILKVNATTQADELRRVLLAASGEIDSETGRTSVGMQEWELALAGQVCLERAVEHWHARPVGFAIVGLDSEAPIRLASNSWDRYANILAPLKDGAAWGFA